MKTSENLLLMGTSGDGGVVKAMAMAMEGSGWNYSDQSYSCYPAIASLARQPGRRAERGDSFMKD